MPRQTPREAPERLRIVNTPGNKYRAKARGCLEPQNPAFDAQPERAGGKPGRLGRKTGPQADDHFALFSPLDGPDGLRPGKQHERPDAANAGTEDRKDENESRNPGQ
jgi:hypothetical protein